MRKGLLLAYLVLLALPVSGSVLIRAPEVTFISNRSVRTACHGAVDTACTNFDDTDLYCICALKGERWTPQVRITSQPHMYLSHTMYRRHEQGHLFDFEQTMTRHAEEIETQLFTQRNACEDFIAQQRLDFPTVLRGYVRASMLLRDNKWLGSLADRK
ncbi:MAG: hypothetical protein ACXW3E_00190 [Thermoanaerobaculia bacterium]